MRIGLRYVVAACSLLALDACATHLTGRKPGSDMIGTGPDATRAVRDALSRCGQDPKGGAASPSEEQRCRLTETDAARGKKPVQDTATIAPRRTP